MRNENSAKGKNNAVISLKKYCGDCLHCKVSAASSQNHRLCFCSKEKSKKYDLELYWLNKSVCKQFEDATA